MDTSQAEVQFEDPGNYRKNRLSSQVPAKHTCFYT